MAVKYPYDASGLEETNHIKDELHSVQPPADISNASFIVARAAPYFLEGLEIWTGLNKTGRKLILGTDYFLTHKFVAGSVQTGRQIYAGIGWVNHAYTGNVYLHYNTLGGDFTIDDVGLIESITNKLYKDVRFVTWDQVEGVPSAFPPNAHEHTVNDFKTMEDTVAALRSIEAAILAIGAGSGTGGDSGAMALIRNHLSAALDAHSKAAVGLGNVPNYAVANEEEALTGRADKLTTPSIVRYMITRAINGLDIPGLEDTVITIQKTLDNTITAVANNKQQIQQFEEQLSQIDRRINDVNQTLSQVSENISRVDNNANNAVGIASTAVAVAEAANENVGVLAARVNNLMYAGNRSLGVGTHTVILPPNVNVRLYLIGAGGGSGQFYESVAQLNKFNGRLTNGEDSTVYALGLSKQAVEPYPIMIAGGGESGNNNYTEAGLTFGGSGGIPKRVTESILVSSLVKSTQPSLIDVTTDVGIAGTNGDSSSSANIVVNGVGGFKLNDTGDLSKRTYGKGRKGSQRAGLGGAGAKVTAVIRNDTNDDFIFQVVVGKAGVSNRPVTPYMEDIFESNGAAVMVIVN